MRKGKVIFFRIGFKKALLIPKTVPQKIRICHEPVKLIPGIILSATQTTKTPPNMLNNKSASILFFAISITRKKRIDKTKVFS